jgi:hypothetical protein
MKTKQYKVIIQYYASDEQDVMLYEDKRKALDVYHQTEFDSCIAWASLFDPSGKVIYDY